MANYADFSILDIWLGSPSGASTLALNDEISEFMSKNELSYNASPTRYNDMTLRNDQEAFYVPTIEFKLAVMDATKVSTLMQVINSKGFVVRYFDLELGEIVYRSMYATEFTISEILRTAARVEGGLVSCKFVSRYGYPYTPRSDTDHCTPENKYHMYQLHNFSTSSNYIPTTVTEEDESYV